MARVIPAIAKYYFSRLTHRFNILEVIYLKKIQFVGCVMARQAIPAIAKYSFLRLTHRFNILEVILFEKKNFSYLVMQQSRMVR
ncbi:MAG: hypothetical protein WBA41_04430 [Rivularia sp. (in: cyanobacteria)]